jgi:hypothetical protein
MQDPHILPGERRAEAGALFCIYRNTCCSLYYYIACHTSMRTIFGIQTIRHSGSHPSKYAAKHGFTDHTNGSHFIIFFLLYCAVSATMNKGLEALWKRSMHGASNGTRET